MAGPAGARRAEGVEFQSYSQVSNAYREHLWMAVERPHLDDIWDPWDTARYTELVAAQAAKGPGGWGAWHAMDREERAAYRYTRAALELFEQAWMLHERGIIEASWPKWQHWMRIWRDTRYFEFVFEDTRERLIDDFCAALQRA